MLLCTRNTLPRSPSCSSAYLFSIFLIVSSATKFANAAQCYYIDGTETGDSHQPCNPDQESSACCAINKRPHAEPDICLDSGLCYAQEPDYAGLIYQNSCTDPTWSSADCPRTCTNFSDSKGIQVAPCPDVERGAWCCVYGDKKDCCDDTISPSIGTLMIPSATSSCPVPASTASTTTPPDADGECTGPDPTAIGAGVGASLGVCLLLALAALWWQGRTYRMKLRDATVESTPAMGTPYSKNVDCYGQTIAEAPEGRRPPVYEISGTERTQQ